MEENTECISLQLLQVKFKKLLQFRHFVFSALLNIASADLNTLLTELLSSREVVVKSSNVRFPAAPTTPSQKSPGQG
jgi:hypothetical protein